MHVDVMLIGRSRGAGAARSLPPGPKAANKSYSIKIMRLKRLWADPLPKCFHSYAAFSPSRITAKGFSNQWGSEEAVWSTLTALCTVQTKALDTTLSYVWVCYVDTERELWVLTYNAILYDSIWYDILYNTIWYNVIHYMIQYNTIWYDTTLQYYCIPYYTILYNTYTIPCIIQ